MLRQSTEWSGILLFGLVRCYLAFHTLIHCIAAWFVCKKKEFKIQMRTTSSNYSNLYFSSWIYCFEIHFYFFRLNDNDNHFVNKARWSSRKKFDFEKVVTIWSAACAYATHWILWLKHCVGRKALWTQHHFDGCVFHSILALKHTTTLKSKKKIVQLGWFRCVADTEYAYADKMDQANTDAHTNAYHTLRERVAKRSHNAWNSNCWINGCWILAV